ncbi:S9 family peptidase [Kutzneria buriramensis]|uniref:Alpha/beta hydrolase family protein n=1 Tax=Kutzneria buriramensis TaxID=1045776 RepID=A0A3E0I6L0_9PSEU|nr:alpha/beta hydrolase [Kutzneria buriramensis]REH54359.1 alpha/beta hydrolase family protein [Kutzneria buriramensis]
MRTVSYGDHPDQVVEVRDNDTDTVVVLVHGGYWRVRYDRSYLAPFAEYLLAQGLSVASVEFRRIGNGGEWPVISQDVNAGVDKAVDLFPGKRIVLVGHSAGGHLALLAADRPGVAKVVSVGGLCDLARAHELGLSDNAVTLLLGGDLGLLAEADPMNRVPPPVPVTLLHGDADTHVPLELSRRYSDKSGAELVVLPGIGHFEPVEPGAAVTVEAIRRD